MRIFTSSLMKLKPFLYFPPAFSHTKGQGDKGFIHLFIFFSTPIAGNTAGFKVTEPCLRCCQHKPSCGPLECKLSGWAGATAMHRGSWAPGSAHPSGGNSSTTQRSKCKVEAENYRMVRKISQKISLEQVRKDDKFQLSEKLTWE